MRSEILPGLSLTVNRQSSDQSDALSHRMNTSNGANVAARLTADANLALGWNKSSYRNAGGALNGNDQMSTYASLQMPIGLDNDFTTDVGTMHSNSGGLDDISGKYFGVTLRNRTRSDVALGLGYRWSLIDTFGVGRYTQRTNAVDFDTSWFPTSSMGINARLSYSSNNGSNISDYITPTVDVRWDLSTDSSLTLRYNFNRARQWDPVRGAILDQQANGLSGRLTYRLGSNSNLDLTYDFLSSDNNGSQWQKALRAFFTIKL
jgi:hypothetical protein